MQIFPNFNKLSPEKRAEAIAKTEKLLSSPRSMFLRLLCSGVLFGAFMSIYLKWSHHSGWKEAIITGTITAVFWTLFMMLNFKHNLSVRLSQLKSGKYNWLDYYKPTTTSSKLALGVLLTPILAVALIIGYSVWAIKAMEAGDKTPQKQIVCICDLVLTVNPGWSAAYNMRGDLYKELEQKNKAIDSYTKAIAVNPKSSYAYAARGSLYLDLKDYNKALDDSNAAISINDQSFCAHCCRGQVYEHMKNYNKAVDDFTKTIAIDPKGGCYLERAYAYGELGQYQKAIDDCNKAISLDAKSGEGYYDRGTIYTKMGQTKQAIIDYTQAIAIDPKHAASYFNRAEAYEKQGLKKLSLTDKLMANKLGYKAGEDLE
jgi:tetratricopeptide (TPR) repeat protein